MQEHTILHDAGRVAGVIKEYWHLFAAAGATLWGSLLMIKRNWLSHYATKEEMKECHDKLHREIHQNRELNTSEHNDLRDLIINKLGK